MLKKYNGHVFTSAMDYVQQAMGRVPQGWNAKSRCRTDHGETVEEVIEELRGLETRMRRRAQAIGVIKEEARGMQTEKIEKELLEELRRVQRNDGEQVEEKQIKALRAELDHFIVAPVDKTNGDCAVM